MSSNIERLRKHFARLARRDHRMAHVAKQLEAARNLNDEFDGPVEIFSAEVDAPHPSLRYETPEDKSFKREEEGMQWKKDIIDFCLGQKELLARRPFEWNEFARVFNEHFGPRLKGETRLADLTIPNTTDRWTASESWIAKAKRINSHFKAGYNRRLASLNRALGGSYFYYHPDLDYFSQPSETLSDFRHMSDDRLVRQKGISVEALQFDRILLAPRIGRADKPQEKQSSKSRR